MLIWVNSVNYVLSDVEFKVSEAYEVSQSIYYEHIGTVLFLLSSVFSGL
jgi:hypothetical protein